MKQIVQNYKTGELRVEEAPAPALRPWGALVENAYSLVSAGTERSKVELAQGSLLAKARQRPDQVKRVLDNMKQEGIIATYQKVMTRLDTPITLGYCSAGTVIQVSPRVGEFQNGDRVACAGEGYGCHAETVYVPRNLCAKVPDSVTLDKAAFAPLGAIALQGLRQARVAVGENVAIIGLGLVGLLTVQILKATGCRVVGIDVDADKVELAHTLGAHTSLCRGQPNLEEVVQAFGHGRGVDAVLITASTKSRDPIALAGALCREKGRVTVVGAVPVDLPRKDYYEKELEVSISRSFGPGTYDESFVQGGIDYPYGYVRWTAQRNMEAFLELLADGRVDLEPLITHRFPIDQAPQAYELLRKPQGRVLGILFEYGRPTDPSSRSAARVWASKDRGRPSAGQPRVALGFIGAGNFAQSYLLPQFRRLEGMTLRGVATATSVSASNAARKFGFAYCTCDYKEILDDPQIDCVVISTRHDLHAKLAAEALKKEKTVYVEKPLALSEEELQQVIAAYHGESSRLMVGFNRRFSPFVRKAKAFLSNRTGPLVMNYRVNAGPLPADYWLYDPVEGGGRILGEVCHFVDLLQHLTGSPPVKVYAQASNSGKEVTPQKENVNIHINFGDGSIGSISYSAVGTLSFPRERIEVMGNGSVVVIDNFKWASFTGQRRTRKARSWWGRDMGYRDEITSFASALKAGGEMPISFREIVAATLATLRILDSIRTGLPVEVDLTGWLSPG